MRAFKRWTGGAMLALVLAAGGLAPAVAQDTASAEETVVEIVETVVEAVEPEAVVTEIVEVVEEAAPVVTAEEVGAVAAYVDNSLLFLIAGLVVMFMAAGFCMLEAGLVRSKNAATQATKNIVVYSVAGLMVFLVGYHLIYPAGDWMIEGYLAGFNVWDFGDREGTNDLGYAKASDWYFQMVFVATAASVVSGTVAERIKLWPFVIFTAILTGFIYPIQASWEWGAGWLDAMDFSDFAGSTLVHSTGGWAALAGALILGPRLGKYGEGGRINPMPGSNIPLAALGTFILWFGWFGFNGGSQLAAGTVADINAVAIIFANTNTAAASGVVAAMILTSLLYKKVDATMVFNGAIGGLVSITAEPLAPELWQAVVIGGVGGVLVVLTVPLLDKIKVDDVVGAIPAHLVCGIWGTAIVPWSNTGVPLVAQLTGIVAIGAFVFISSSLVWLALKYTVGIRVSEEEEIEGLDRGELGLEAYPDFTKQ